MLQLVKLHLEDLLLDFVMSNFLLSLNYRVISRSKTIFFEETDQYLIFPFPASISPLYKFRRNDFLLQEQTLNISGTSKTG